MGGRERSATMRLTQVRLTNYRGFEEITIPFNHDITILVGNNGSGKSSVLDGLAIGLASLFLGLEGESSGSIHKNDVRLKTFELGSRLERQAQYPARIRCDGELYGHRISWERSLNTEGGSTTYGDAKDLTVITKKVNERVKSGDSTVILPIISYYSTGRLWAKKREKRDSAKVSLQNRYAGYADCLDVMSNDKLLYAWLQQMTYQELQEGKSLPELSAVKKAILFCFNSSGSNTNMGIAEKCVYNVKSEEIEITYTLPNGEKEIRSVGQMSDGYRNMLCMVADIAYRMALLNPQLLDQVLDKTTGVVLIDEIDLHLHPAWQRHVIATLHELFPMVQFVVSTHSPSVISTVSRDQILILDNGGISPVSVQTYGKDVNSIMETVMNVANRPDDIKEKFDIFYHLLSCEQYDKARSLLLELVEILSENDHDVISAAMALDLEMME